MSSCCRAAACEEMFDAGVAEWYLRRYERRGFDALERSMLAALPPQEVAGARVLEIGGGVGPFQVELLKRGAREGEVVELVEAYRPYAASLASRAGVSDRSTFRVADLLEAPASAAPADVVVLNRVVCCSEEGLDLVRLAAGLTTGTLLLSFPRGTPLAMFAARAQRRVAGLMRRRYRFFVRKSETVRSAAEAAGLELAAHGKGLVWEYLALRRPDARPAEAAA